MSRAVKINLNGGVKRIVSTLICLMMVLATFPMHMLKDTVCADGGVQYRLNWVPQEVRMVPLEMAAKF